jgi:tricorn protease-like protein
MNADGSGQKVLTNNNGVLDGTPSFSPDGSKIVFLRPVSGQQQLFVMNAADGSQQVQLTFPPGANLFPSYGEIKAGARDAATLAAGRGPEAFKDQFRCSRTSSTGP